jgi:hypothetical protein
MRNYLRSREVTLAVFSLLISWPDRGTAAEKVSSLQPPDAMRQLETQISVIQAETLNSIREEWASLDAPAKYRDLVATLTNYLAQNSAHYAINSRIASLVEESGRYYGMLSDVDDSKNYGSNTHKIRRLKKERDESWERLKTIETDLLERHLFLSLAFFSELKALRLQLTDKQLEDQGLVPKLIREALELARNTPRFLGIVPPTCVASDSTPENCAVEAAAMCSPVWEGTPKGLQRSAFNHEGMVVTSPVSSLEEGITHAAQDIERGVRSFPFPLFGPASEKFQSPRGRAVLLRIARTFLGFCSTLNAKGANFHQRGIQFAGPIPQWLSQLAGEFAEGSAPFNDACLSLTLERRQRIRENLLAREHHTLGIPWNLGSQLARCESFAATMCSSVQARQDQPLILRYLNGACDGRSLMLNNMGKKLIESGTLDTRNSTHSNHQQRLRVLWFCDKARRAGYEWNFTPPKHEECVPSESRR